MIFNLLPRLFVLTFINVLLAKPVCAQNDTTWYDASGHKPILRDKAASYSLIFPKPNGDYKPVTGTFYFQDFYKSELNQSGEADFLEVVFQQGSWKLTAYDAKAEEIFQITEQKNWEESPAISQYIWVENHLYKLSHFYGYKGFIINTEIS